MSSKTIIYILPHNDDELFVIPKITNDLKNQDRMLFFFLSKSEKRFKESQFFLNRLGVNNQSIISIGEITDAIDGDIHQKMDSIYDEIDKLLNHLPQVDEIVCTAFEGGHNDHDVASIVARVLARKYQAQYLEFFLYNGYRTHGKFYRVSYPFNLTNKMIYKYRFPDVLAVMIAPFIFLSQKSAFLGLWPLLVLKILMFKPLIMNHLEPPQNLLPEHTGVPLYERWGRISQEKLHVSHNDFVKKFKKLY